MSAQLEILRRHVADAPAPAAPPAGGNVVVVGSGKGGVGTSTVAALLALLAGTGGSRVLLVDADDAVGSLALVLGVEARAGWGSLRGGGAAPESLLVPLTEQVVLLPGGGAGAESAATPAERRALFRRIAALYAGYDLVVVDGGSRLEPVLGACAAGVGRLLAVTVAERIALAATYALMKAVEARYPDAALELLVNRSDDQGARAAFDDVAAATTRFLARGIGFAGALPDDDCLRAAMDAGMTLQDAAEGSPAAALLHPLALRLAREAHAAALSDGRTL